MACWKVVLVPKPLYSAVPVRDEAGNGVRPGPGAGGVEAGEGVGLIVLGRRGRRMMSAIEVKKIVPLLLISWVKGLLHLAGG